MTIKEVGVTVEFAGEGLNEIGYVTEVLNIDFPFEVGKQVVAIDPSYLRPTEVDFLIGDPSKAKRKLGWEPKYDLQTMIKEMIQTDLKEFEEKGNMQLEYLVS